jgi:hypothetical protein
VIRPADVLDPSLEIREANGRRFGPGGRTRFHRSRPPSPRRPPQEKPGGGDSAGDRDHDFFEAHPGRPVPKRSEREAAEQKPGRKADDQPDPVSHGPRPWRWQRNGDARR